MARYGRASALRPASYLVAGVVVGLAASGGYTAIAPVTYESTAKVFVGTSVDDPTGPGLENASLFATARVKSYAQLIDSPSVLNSVLKDFGKGLSIEKLEKMVSIDVPLNTVVIDITVTDTSAKRASEIANGVAYQLPYSVNQIEDPTSKKKSDPVTVSVFQDALPAKASSSPKVALNLAAGFVGGLVVGLIVLLIVNYVRTASAPRRRPQRRR